MYFWYVAIKHTIIFKQGWRQEFSDGGLTLLTRGLKYGFQGTIDAKNLRKYRFSPSDGGLACPDGGYCPLPFPGATPVFKTNFRKKY